MSHVSCLASLLALIALYVLAVCTAFALPRFFLPLTPLYALAAAWLCGVLYQRLQQASAKWTPPLALAGMLLLLWALWPSLGVGARYVLGGQPADEVAAIALVQANLHPNDLLLICVSPEVPLGKYSAIAHRGTLCPTDADGPTALAGADGAAYLLWSTTRGDPPLPDSALLGRAGQYTLYRLHIE